MLTPGNIILNFVLVALTCSNATLGQNLVPNPGFEVYSRCPDGLTPRYRPKLVDHWFSANEGTPDYFNPCSNEAGVPYNWAGTSEAAEGKAYAGIITYLKGSDYREYIQCQLLAPLKAETEYSINFKFRLSDNCGFVSNSLGVMLTKAEIKFLKANRLKTPPTLSLVNEKALQPETGTWEEFSMTYKAQGREAYLTLGSFTPTEDLKIHELISRKDRHHMLDIAAYYYIDDLSIIEINSELPSHHYAMDSTYLFENVHFEFNSAVFDITDEEELLQLIRYLQTHLEHSVVLAGHTDEIGADSYNFNLSLFRAKAVKEFLMSQGIDEQRISVEALGEKVPLAAGQDAASRALNRRVSFRIINN